MKIEDFNITIKKERTKYGVITRFYQNGVILKREFGPKPGEIVFLEGTDKLRLVEILSREIGQNIFKYRYLDDESIEKAYGYFYKVNGYA